MSQKSRGAFCLLMTFVLALSTLTAGIMPVSAAGTAFTDVSDTAYYAEAVGWAVEKAITKGTSDTAFSPGDGCTRGQCVTFLYRYAGSPDVDVTKALQFEDINSSDYYAPAVAWAVDNGVTTGTSDTTFSPGANCSRAQIVTFLWRYNAKPDAESAGTFTDVKSGAYYADAVFWAVAQDITKGTSETTFNPDQTCSRAQIVTFLYRMDQKGAEKAHIITEEEGQRMIDLIDEISKLEEQGKGLTDIEEYLLGLDWMDMVSETPDGGLCCRTSFGVTGVWNPRGQGYMSSPDAKAASLAETPVLLSDESASGSGHEVQRVAVLCPYASSDSMFQYYVNGYKMLTDEIEETLSDCVTTFIRDEDVSLSQLKSLDKYDMVLMESHGYLSNVTDSAWAVLDSDPYFMTGEFANSVNAYVWLSSDFFYGRTVIDIANGRIGVGGNFFKHYYSANQLEGMFFHLGFCNSMRTSAFADGLISRGAAWAEGWTNKVRFDNDYMHLCGIINYLLEGNTVSESMELTAESDEVKTSAQEDCDLVWKGDRGYHLTHLPGNSITDSWEKIIANINNGTYKTKYKIGDMKELDLGSEGIIEMQIAAFDADELADGSGTAAITWISRQLLQTDYQMNPALTVDRENSTKTQTMYKIGTGSIGGWGYTELRSWLQSDIKALIPPEVLSSIKPVNKYSTFYDDSNTWYTDGVTVEDVWIPSCRELGLSYYETKGPVYSELFTSLDDRIKYKKDADSPSRWWLRSASNGSCNQFGLIYSSGDMNSYSADTTKAVAFGFCM